MGALFLLMELVAVAAYAILGSRIGRYLRGGRTLQWFNRVSGALMLAFSVGIVAMKRPVA
ncbi:hypothetical protein EVC62_12425 [Salinicola endophyticus]|uniref:LysE type translocator n=1 Tax=Salinicola endophyticus TaxID=1949083 RepID=A0ABY8FHG0_9GAMM|nr:hypothetical protein [Salinicola endophyticus]WFF42245.1 hypothetical protein EVC62_12425 [Salinicola endophyticus]